MWGKDPGWFWTLTKKRQVELLGWWNYRRDPRTPEQRRLDEAERKLKRTQNEQKSFKTMLMRRR